MKANVIIVIFIFGGFLVLSGCTANKHFFKDKLLQYSSELVGEPYSITPNAFYIDFYKDSINRIGYPLEFFENKVVSPAAYPFATTPFTFEKRGKTIFINYFIKGEKFRKKYFSLSQKDSVKTSNYEYLCGHRTSDNWVVTKFTGKDTVIIVEGKSIKCWIFEEKYSHLFPPNRREQIIYLSKGTLLPIQVMTTWLDQENQVDGKLNKPVFLKKMISVMKRPWDSANKKWRYSKCPL